jgi:hypothetical protein
MGFGSNDAEDILDDAESVSTPASGGKWHLLGYGILVPLVIGYFAFKAWVDREALWISSEGIARDKITGDAARAMAACYACAAAFMHFRWCWGLLGFERVSRAGVLIALYVAVGAMLTALGFWIGGM